ncbi:3,2-trans-enoyl-CoA isomerase [Rhodotorula toruloides]|uniref:ClpP crotonase n=1 Tax=Rhodotorula toruloides TaxID=5286 RepID=A0A2T0A0A0_RHOTO|nr:3,2-trans-enoyl-CoA isomerase [Rhodotorula toruloides]PRQ71435.1 ClpP crotonase [Rhodotorula toruloides]
MAPADAILVEIQAPFAIITLNQPQKKNALDSTLYKRLSSILQDIDRKPEVFVTVLTGKGDFFSAGADVKATREAFSGEDARVSALERLSGGNLDLTRSFYRHSKILVAGLNGPAIGLSAALLGYCDFIYAVENAYFLTPFSAISLVCEGGASQSLIQRMGLAKANEALLFGKKLSAQELHQNGFFNGLFPPQPDTSFRKALLASLEQQLAGLELDAIVKSKQLIRAALPDPEQANAREVFAGAERFATGKPQARFAQLASKQMRHKI